MIRILPAVLMAITSLTACAQEPSLMMTLADFHQRSLIAQREPWARADLANLIHEADDFPASYEKSFGLSSVQLPPEGGQWLHWYVCPATGSKLEFHPPNHNVCPDTGKEYPGYPFDQVVYQLRNDALHRAAVTLGLAYRFTGNIKYAAEATSLLEDYADVYSTWKLHDNNGKPTANGARAYSQTLDESIWLIDIAWSYDLVRGSGEFTAADKQHIENDLLRASYRTVSKAPNPPGYNIQAWINAAIAAVGYTLHDPALINQAIDGPIGFRHQMRNYVHEGFWIEGAYFYQFYAMRALVMTARMATLANTDLWKQEPALLSLFQGPLGIVLPDGSLPAFNDSNNISLYEQDYLYESAYAASRDPDLLRVIAPHGRNDLEALLFGVEHLPPAPRARLSSRVFPESGFATLRNPKNDFTIVAKFGPHGGAHGHYDKLDFVLFAQGRVLGLTPGTQQYGLPIHARWDSMSIAHNTVSVDQLRQLAATGKLLDWETGANFTSVTMDAGPVYAAADLQRTILLTPEYSLVVDRDTSLDGKPHAFDWIYHNLGTATVIVPTTLQPFTGFPDMNGYEYLNDATTEQTAADVRVRFKAIGNGHLYKVDQPANSSKASDGVTEYTATAPNPRLQIPAIMNLTMLGAPATQFIMGTAPGPDLRVPIPFVLVRRAATAVNFIALLAPSGPANASKRASEITVQHLPLAIIVRGPHFRDIIQPGARLSFRREMR
jgi:hypothetical protein